MLPIYGQKKPGTSVPVNPHHGVGSIIRLPPSGGIATTRPVGQVTVVRNAPRPAAPVQGQNEFNIHIMKPTERPAVVGTPSGSQTTTGGDFVISNLKFHSSTAANFDSIKEKNEQIYISSEETTVTHVENQTEAMPTFGEGSAYGYEARDAARKRRWAMVNDRIIAQNQANAAKPPAWSLCVGKSKSKKIYHAVMEGRVVDNCAYFVMKQSANNRIEAYHVDDWYNMVPRIGYCYLNEDEAEEEFSKRHKTHNHFNTMMKRRLTDKPDGNNDESDPEEGGKRTDRAGGGKANRKNKSKNSDENNFLVVEGSDGDSDGNEGLSSEEEAPEGGAGAGNKKKPKAPPKKGKKKKSGNADKSEDSDLDDHDGDEIDYISTSSDEEQLPDEERARIYAETGVEDEKGLRKTLDDSGSLSGEDDDEEKEEGTKAPSSPNEGSVEQGPDDESEEESGDEEFPSDMELENQGLDMTPSGATQSKASDANRPSGSKDISASKSKTASSKRGPTGAAESASASSKRSKAIGSTTASVLDKLQPSIRTEVEELVRKYLYRKPITTASIIKKIHSKNIIPANIDMSELMVALISKLNPEKIKFKGVQKFYLRK